MSRTYVLALVLAGGEGTRLRPLTAYQAKPAVPFAHGYRIVDFVLGNLVNSSIKTIYLLAQYKPETLIEHVHAVWKPQTRAQGCTIEVLLPEDVAAPGNTFSGTADAVSRCLQLLEEHDPEAVAVFAADHVYRMDVRQMAGYHFSRGADVTVAGVPVPIDQGSAFGIMATDRDARIRRFDEKPCNPEAMPGRPDRAFASMGNYLFRPEVLVALLEEAAARGGTDFGKDVMPRLPDSGLRAFAYDFGRNQLPGIQPYEDRTYWRDVGTLEALAQAQHDIEGARPRFDLRNRAWPIRRDLLPALGGLPGSASATERFAALRVQAA
jgi:glucose-1-phosphate adenylyltransferase